VDSGGGERYLHSFGDAFAHQGRLDKAEKMYQRALQGKEKAWGPEHTSTLDTVNNLGILYENLRRLDEAEKMFQRALQGCEKAWGPEHTSTLNTVNNLAGLYWKVGRLDETEKMCQRALQGYEKHSCRQSIWIDGRPSQSLRIGTN
jgi:tetratricopeptide (TPR) repeat protein